MSGVDQQSGGTRLRRLLTRALVVTGTTVAGTSAAWLLGTGVATAGAGCPSGGPAPSPDVPAVDTVRPESARAPHEPRPPREPRPTRDTRLPRDTPAHEAAKFDLADLDSAPLGLKSCMEGRTEPRGALATVTDSARHVLPGDVLRSAEPVLTPVRRAADAVLPGEIGSQPLPETVDDGLDALQPLVPSPAGPPSTGPLPPHPLPGGGDPADSGDPTGGESPVTVPPRPASAPPAGVTPSSSAPTAAASATVARTTAHETFPPSDADRSHAPAVPHAPASTPLLPMPAVVPNAAACGSADGHSNSSLGLGGHPLDIRRPASFASGASGHRAYALPGGTGPQPGATPD